MLREGPDFVVPMSINAENQCRSLPGSQMSSVVDHLIAEAETITDNCAQPSESLKSATWKAPLISLSLRDPTSLWFGSQLKGLQDIDATEGVTYSSFSGFREAL